MRQLACFAWFAVAAVLVACGSQKPGQRDVHVTSGAKSGNGVKTTVSGDASLALGAGWTDELFDDTVQACVDDGSKARYCRCATAAMSRLATPARIEAEGVDEFMTKLEQGGDLAICMEYGDAAGTKNGRAGRWSDAHAEWLTKSCIKSMEQQHPDDYSGAADYCECRVPKMAAEVRFADVVQALITEKPAAVENKADRAACLEEAGLPADD